MRLPLLTLGDARGDRVPNPETWGSYYETDPRVFAFGREHLEPFLVKWLREAPAFEARVHGFFGSAGLLRRQRRRTDRNERWGANDYAGEARGVGGRSRQSLGGAPETIGIFGHNSVEWAIAFLAASVAGKTIVPVPTFFTSEQREHLIRDAGVSRIIVTDAECAAIADFPSLFHVPECSEGALPQHVRDGGLIIYTSGSTGTPKGVRLVSGQAMWSAQTLAQAIGATPQDKYLSLLPLPTLLELICGVMIPVLVGGPTHFDGQVARNAGAGVASDVAAAFERARPTTSVLVPQLLGLYAMQLMAAGKRPHEELRFVAVGGAAIPPVLAQGARMLGIPVYEGYGLSECSSVVSVNRAGDCQAGTAGKPLPGLQVSIEDGEIVVEGPSIMDGYLHGEAPPRKWRTGMSAASTPTAISPFTAGATISSLPLSAGT